MLGPATSRHRGLCLLVCRLVCKQLCRCRVQRCSSANRGRVASFEMAKSADGKPEPVPACRAAWLSGPRLASGSRQQPAEES